MSDFLEKMAEKLILGDVETVIGYVEKALDEGLPAKQILDDGLIAGMDVVGQKMKAGDMFIPEVLRSAKVMQTAMGKLTPHMAEGDSLGLGTVLIGTVQGDLHDIGKNLVAMMLQGAGFNVIDLGTDITPQAFVESAKENDPVIIGMSALLTTTMPKMEETVKALEEAGIRDKIKIMAGGAPVTQDFVDKIGADAYGANAAAATDRAKALVG